VGAAGEIAEQFLGEQVAGVVDDRVDAAVLPGYLKRTKKN
jgi:hypothetical protein